MTTELSRYSAEYPLERSQVHCPIPDQSHPVARSSPGVAYQHSFVSPELGAVADEQTGAHSPIAYGLKAVVTPAYPVAQAQDPSSNTSQSVGIVAGELPEES